MDTNHADEFRKRFFLLAEQYPSYKASDGAVIAYFDALKKFDFECIAKAMELAPVKIAPNKQQNCRDFMPSAPAIAEIAKIFQDRVDWERKYLENKKEEKRLLEAAK